MADNRMQNFLKLLNIAPQKHKSIAVVGGGGKTSLIFRLAEELLIQGQKVIITTTTHMAYEPSKPFALHGDASAVREALSSQGMVIAAEYDSSTGKISSLSSQKLKGLTEYGAILLIEADGARRMPVKIPEDWEPVIPDFVQLVIGVIGLDCLDRPIFKTAYSAENLAFFLDKTELDSITSTDLFKIAVSESGLRKDVQKREFRVYFNKADVLGEIARAEELVKKLKEAGVQSSYGSLIFRKSPNFFENLNPCESLKENEQ